MPSKKYVDFKTIKASVSMLQILDHYGLSERLRLSGDSLSGTCPLHNGDNPTQFRVSISKSCWNCFGQCKRGGNVLDFVALKEGVSVREAAVRISEWFHLSFDVPTAKESADEKVGEAGKPGRAKSGKRAESVSEPTGPNKPLGFQLQNLDTAHPYLAERGLTRETIAEFGLGHCASGSMNGRIVIPIHNPDGKLVAYAGRWPGEPPVDTPKYKLPTGFKKSQEVFNIHRAIQESAEQPLVIVEGFLDCIRLWQHGVKRVVALMGSTLSPVQEELIRKHTTAHSRIIVMLDEDEAGRAGREQIVQRLVSKAFVRVVHFEKEGQQPEDLSAEKLFGFVGRPLNTDAGMIGQDD